MSFYTEVAADSPLGWWKLNETSGTTVANDGSGGASSHTITGTGATRNITGLHSETGNKAITFSTSSAAYAQIGTGTSGNDAIFAGSIHTNNALTIETIMRINHSTDAVGTIVRQAASGDGYNLELGATPSGGKYRMRGWVRGAGTGMWTGYILNPNEWYHVVFTYQTNGMKIYVNGIEEASTSLSSHSWPQTTDTASLFAAANNWVRLQGVTVDEIVIYKSTLSEGRIQAHAEELGLWEPEEEPDATVNVTVTNIAVSGKNTNVTADQEGRRLRPNADVTSYQTDAWTSSNGTNYYNTLNNLTSVDNSWVRRTVGPGESLGTMASIRVHLSDPLYPILEDTNHTVHYRYYLSHTGSTIYLDLYQGTTHIAQIGQHNTPQQSWTAGSYTLTTTEAGNITNYDDLRVRIGATAGFSSGDTRRIELSTVWLELPNAPTWVEPDVSNIGVQGHDVEVTATQDAIVNANVTNIAVRGENPVLPNTAVVAESTNITVAGKQVISGVVFIIPVEGTNIAVQGHDVEVTAVQHVEVEVDNTNVDIAGHDAAVSTFTLTTVAPNIQINATETFVSDGRPQFIRPNSTIFGQMGQHTGINTVTPNDNTFVSAWTFGMSPTPFRGHWGLSGAVKPASNSATLRLRKRLQQFGGSVSGHALDVAIKEGNTTRAFWGNVSLGGSAFSTQTFTFDTSSIVNFNNLSLEVTGIIYPVTAQAGSTRFEISWAEGELAAKGAPPPTNHVGIGVEAANIGISGKDVIAGVFYVQHVQVTNIRVRSRMPTIVLPGQVYQAASETDIKVKGHDVTVTTERNPILTSITTNIAVRGHETIVKTVDDSFIFIPIEDSSLTARDAQMLVSASIGSLVYRQEKFYAFKMGNVGIQPVTLRLSIRSVNEGIPELVTLSTDKVNYSPTITIGNLGGNAITDPIWLKFNAEYKAVGLTTFVLNVEQSNA